jgi:hypothetical protein
MWIDDIIQKIVVFTPFAENSNNKISQAYQYQTRAIRNLGERQWRIDQARRA